LNKAGGSPRFDASLAAGLFRVSCLDRVRRSPLGFGLIHRFFMKYLPFYIYITTTTTYYY